MSALIYALFIAILAIPSTATSLEMPGFTSSSSSSVSLKTDKATIQTPDITGAIEKLRQIRASGDRGPIVISLPAGIFRLNQPLRLTATEAGSDFGPLEIRGSADGDTILSGAEEIPNAAVKQEEGMIIVPVTDAQSNLILRRYDRTIAANIAFYQGHRALTPARWPVKGFTRELTQNADSVHFDAAPAGGWKREPAPLVNGYLDNDWGFMTWRASQSSSDLAAYKAEITPSPSSHRPRLAIENLFSALNTEGSYAIDPEQHMAKLHPYADTQHIEISQLANLVIIDGAYNVEIHDIVFEKSLDHIIKISNSNHITLHDCEIRLGESNGAFITGGTNVTVNRCFIHDIAELGIYVSGGNRNELIPAHHIISANIISKYGLLGKDYKAGVRIEGVGIQVAGCIIHDGFGSGIIFSGNDNDISGNEIYEVLADSDDAGAIYTGRDWTKRGNKVIANYVHNVGFNMDKKFISSIYLDDMASGNTISENVIEYTNRGIVIGGGRDNLVEDNVSIKTEGGFLYFDSRGLDEAYEDLRRKMIDNFNAVPVGSEKWKAEYPALSRLLEENPYSPIGNRVDRNIVINQKLIARGSNFPPEQVLDSQPLSLNENEITYIHECLNRQLSCDAVSSNIYSKLRTYLNLRMKQRPRYTQSKSQ